MTRHQQMLDQSRLLSKRARKLQAESRPRIQRTTHRWMVITLGRVCSECMKAQAPWEYTDDLPCTG